MDLSNENIIHVKKNEIEYIQFKKLLEYKNIFHAFIIKPLDFKVRVEGKIPNAYYDYFNSLNIDINFLVRPNQTHTNKIICINDNFKYNEPNIFLDYLKETDGTITNKSFITLASTSADCILILLYDPVKNVIGNIHSGWRGTFSKIAKEAIVKMKCEYGSNPSDILACICPSIRFCHFEVDIDVKEECENIFKNELELENIIRKGEIKDNKQKYYIDTIQITKDILALEGVLPENIIDSGICSICMSAKIHSRRAEGESYGLNAAIIRKI